MRRMLYIPEQTVPLSEVVRRTGMTHRAARFYEEQGLVRSIRDVYGQRHYDRPTLERLDFIGEARRGGLSIRQIGELLAIGDQEGKEQQSARTQEAYRVRLAEVEAQLEKVEASAQALGFTLQPQRPRLIAL